MKRLNVDQKLSLGGGLLLIAAALTTTAAALNSAVVGPVPWLAPPPSHSAQQPAEPNSANPENPVSPSSPATMSPTPGTPVCAAHVHYLNLTSKHKKNSGAYGDPVNVSSQYDVINAMRDYAYQDPAGAAILTSAFDPDADMGKIGTRLGNYIDGSSGHHMWCQEVNAMLDTALDAKFSLEGVDSGSATFIMEKTSGKPPVTIDPKTTDTSGPAAVFEFYGHRVALRLDLHFQPVEWASTSN